MRWVRTVAFEAGELANMARTLRTFASLRYDPGEVVFSFVSFCQALLLTPITA